MYRQMDTPPKQPAPSRAFAVAAELRATIGKIKRKIAGQGNAADLTLSQVAVVLRLEQNGPATTSGLARSEGMRPQSMATVVSALESAGLIGGTADPADGRQTLFSLTDTARQWLSEGRAARQDWLTRIIEARLSAGEQEQLLAAIGLLKRLIDD
ncbi:MAG: MarR family transcriptional regulator [Devosia sp.]|nr:MarR family transcriptional regulator [Devosia sp.]